METSLEFNKTYKTDTGISMARAEFYAIGIVRTQTGGTVLSVSLPNEDKPLRFSLNDDQRAHLIELLSS